MFTFAGSKSGSAVRLSCRPCVMHSDLHTCNRSLWAVFLYVIYFEAVSPVDYYIDMLYSLF